MPVAANTTLATSRCATWRLIDFGRERRVAAAIADRLAIKTPSIDTPVANLSAAISKKWPSRAGLSPSRNC